MTNNKKEKLKKRRNYQHMPVNKQKYSLYVFIIITLISLIAIVSVTNQPTIELEIPLVTAKKVVIYDRISGTVLYSKEGDSLHSPASLTKLMTIFLVYDAIEEGKLLWTDTVEIRPNEATAYGSKYGMQVGETWTLKQLVAGTLLNSGCDCVEVLVRLISGNIDDFVVLMNDKSKKLGLDSTIYQNATGIDQANHYSTAKELALLADILLETYPEITEFTGKNEMTIDGRRFKNLNIMSELDPRILGLKTGTTQIGGFNLITYAKEGDSSYIIVLLDSDNDLSRFYEADAILNTLFQG